MAVSVRSFVPARDARAVAGILTLSFGNWSPRGHLPGLLRVPKSDWRNHRVVVDDGKVVAFLHIVSREIYVGRALLHVGGIAGVCTDPSARKKGYASALMNDANDFMRRDGYDFGLLYGIPNFYHKFGYEVVMSRYFLTIPQSEIPDPSAPIARAAVTKKDLPALLRLYNAQARFRDGNVLRKKMWLRKNSFKITGPRGRLDAYAVWNSQDGSLIVSDAAARDARSGRTLLSALKRVAWNHGLDHVNVRFPFGYPLTGAIRRLNCSFTRTNTLRKGCMGRVLNLKPLARKMAPEWRRLFSLSEVLNQSGRLSVQIDDEVLTISFSKGRVTTAVGHGRASSKMPQEKFSQLLFGYAPLAEVSRAAGVRIAPRDLRLFEILFPERTSFLFATDEF
jgi:predicted acetyltransferase